MKNLVISAALIAIAFSANAQYGNNNRYDAQRPNEQRYDSRYDGNNGYQRQNDPRYDNRRDIFRSGDNCNVSFFDQMQQEARMKILSGTERGLITQFEAKRLWSQFEYIKDKKYRFASNGFLSPYEKDELVADFRDLNSSIEHEIHDGERYSSRYGEHDRSWRRGF